MSLSIRDAQLADVAALGRLIRELGYEASEADVAERMRLLFENGLPPLVADDEGIVGCLTLWITQVLHRPRPVGRISLLVVAEAMRGRGIGQALVTAAEARLAERGCGLIEVTSNLRRERAHVFYERLGYERTSFRFGKTLSAP